MRYLIWFGALLLLIPMFSQAHGLVTTQTQTAGDYTIEFEYNTLGTIFAGDYTVYDVYLLKNGTKEPINYNSAFMRIEKKNGPAVMAGNLAQSSDIAGFASMSGTLADAGRYTATVYFYKDQKNIGTAKFDFNVANPSTYFAPVAGKSNNKYLLAFEGILIGLATGVGATLWLKSKKKI